MSTSSYSAVPSTSYGFRPQSPLPPPANANNICLSATTKTYKFFRKLFKFQQMDFEFAMWQCFNLFVAPQKVYRNFNYRKHTKSQFARDDPAFLVLLLACMFVTSFAFGYVLHYNFWSIIALTLYVVFVDCILTGIIVATVVWIVANKYFRKSQLDADIEWGYAFDVHLNAFFPPLMLLHFVLIILHGLVWDPSIRWQFHSYFLGNSLWLIAIAYYIYITFLGYNCLPHLKNTRIILFPLPVLFLFYIVSIIIGWNFAVTFIEFYKFRV